MLTSIWTQPPVLAAMVTGFIALILALWNFFSARKNQSDIEILKNDLAQKKSENDARREYEFEARKRIYTEYEPLLFQLMEASNNLTYRIQNIAKTFRDGNLQTGGWFSKFNYYSKSTIYKLFVPLAIYKIMQKKLTLVDLTLDKSINLRYSLVKQLYLSFTDDYELAQIFKKIDYDPNATDWRNLRTENQTKYWRQGMLTGHLDKIIEIFIEKDDRSYERIISFSEFEKKLEEIDEKVIRVERLHDLFLNFDPKSRPVLWRILITQYLIINVLNKLKELPPDEIGQDFSIRTFFKYNEQDNDNLKWSNKPELAEEVEEPFKVGIAYLKSKFK